MQQDDRRSRIYNNKKIKNDLVEDGELGLGTRGSVRIDHEEGHHLNIAHDMACNEGGLKMFLDRSWEGPSPGTNGLWAVGRGPGGPWGARGGPVGRGL